MPSSEIDNAVDRGRWDEGTHRGQQEQATDCLPRSGHALIGTSSKTMTRAESHPGATRASTGIDMVYPNEEQGLISAPSSKHGLLVLWGVEQLKT